MRPVLFHLGDIAVPSFWAMSFLGFLAALLWSAATCSSAACPNARPTT